VTAIASINEDVVEQTANRERQIQFALKLLF